MKQFSPQYNPTKDVWEVLDPDGVAIEWFEDKYQAYALAGELSKPTPEEAEENRRRAKERERKREESLRRRNMEEFIKSGKGKTADYARSIRAFRQDTRDMLKRADEEGLSPEAVDFLSLRLKRLRTDLGKLIERVEAQKGKGGK